MKTKSLPVYTLRDDRHRLLMVAAKSQREACVLLGCSAAEYVQFGGMEYSKELVALANGAPGKVWWKPVRGGEWQLLAKPAKVEESETSTKPRRMPKKRKVLTKAESRTEQGRFALHLQGLLNACGWDSTDLADRLKRAKVVAAEPAIRAWLRGDGMPKAKDLRAIGRIFMSADVPSEVRLSDPRHILPPE
jgi:hypothetical protein